MYEACLSLYAKEKTKTTNQNKIELMNEINEFRFFHCKANPFSGHLELDHSTFSGSLEELDWETVELWRIYLDCCNQAISNSK